MNRQLRLELRRAPSHRREEFIVSASNAEAVRALDAWPGWHGGVLALAVQAHGQVAVAAARFGVLFAQHLPVDGQGFPQFGLSLAGAQLALEAAAARKRLEVVSKAKR